VQPFFGHAGVVQKMLLNESLTRELCKTEAGGGCGGSSPEGALDMKSKLSAVLVAAGCVLAASPANAISATINSMATFTSVSGAVLFDDFDTVQDTTIGTITGGRPQDPSHGTPPLRPEISS
jgi:hypothetical protein